jgi:sulfatase maturation enzyme AslB (radical SAM superfamily)
MARFLTTDAFEVPEKRVEHLPFRFECRANDYLLSNMVGDFITLTHEEFERLATLRIAPGDDLYERAYAGHLIGRRGQRAQHQLLALRLRSRMAFLREVTPLHLFVVTLRCEHSCPYCQVSRQSTDRSRYDMSEDTAQRALKVALASRSLILRRMLTDRPIGYVDLRSPAGIGLGALVYNYDGRVFASDEGRMLAEMGDKRFELGRVETSSYESLILSDKLVDLVASSLTQCAHECSDCVFEPHCGADPVYHHATQRDPLGIKPLSEFCARQKGIMSFLLSILEHEPENAEILRRWGGM